MHHQSLGQINLSELLQFHDVHYGHDSLQWQKIIIYLLQQEQNKESLT